MGQKSTDLTASSEQKEPLTTVRRILGNSALCVSSLWWRVTEWGCDGWVVGLSENWESWRVCLLGLVRREKILGIRQHVKVFDYVVVNVKGKLEDSVKRVESILDAEKSRVDQRVVWMSESYDFISFFSSVLCFIKQIWFSIIFWIELVMFTIVELKLHVLLLLFLRECKINSIPKNRFMYKEI